LLVRAELLPIVRKPGKRRRRRRLCAGRYLAGVIVCSAMLAVKPEFSYERLRCDRTRKSALAHWLPNGAKSGAAQVRRRSWRLARAYRRHGRRLDHYRGLLQAAIGGTLRRPRPQADDGSRRTFFRGAAVFLSVRARSLVATCAALRPRLRYRDFL